ncbi:unnamed protein product (mitochondrion) [Plasmodiophora brassicae]|uniref:Uncharacterized protein n=1 Tax=Plasmodiophora brassicae TaxID=37360 RepID=A0A0G4IU42_PLABS|nr:hypothetical protein PBRA_006866 [Plasmodiophora brassicae]SPR00618.1 unnamed protein product [Plasmodiophora brassicae]
MEAADQECTITDESTAAAVSEYLHRFVARAGVSVQLSERASKYDGFTLRLFRHDQLHFLFNGPRSDPHVQSITQSLYDALHPEGLVITEQSTAGAVRQYLLRFIRSHDVPLTLHDADSSMSGRILLGLTSDTLRLVFNERPPEEFLDALYRDLHPDAVSADLTAASAYPEPAILVEGFTEPFRDPSGCLKSIANYIRRCSASYRWQRRPFLSPYTSCVQSTLHGKSRTFRELARHYYRTVYFCFRPSGSTGYPKRTDQAINTLLKGKDAYASPGQFAKVLSYRLGQLVYRALCHLPDPVLNDNPNDPETVAEFPSETCGPQLFDGLPSTNLNGDQVQDLRRRRPEIVLFVMDEARQLLDQYVAGVDLFRCLREAVRQCDNFLNKIAAVQVSIFAVFIDTSWPIPTFSPPGPLDSSARPSSAIHDAMECTDLFQPIVLRGSFDVHFASSDGEDVDWNRLRVSDDWLKTGRAGLSLVGRLSESKSLAFLKLKLMGGGPAELKSDPGAGRLSNLALFLSRVAAMVNPNHPFASALVAGCMGTMLDTDLDRKRCLMSYMPEALVAFAAANKWHEGVGHTFADAIVPAVHDALLSGALDQGFVGELVGQVLFLFACDRACDAARKRSGSVVSVVDVLAQLLPSDTSDQLAEDAVPPGMRGAMLACGQFVNLAYKPDLRAHVRLAERHCFGVLPEGFPGWDLYGPVFLSPESVDAQGGASRDDHPMEDAPCPSERIGVLGVQVKACTDAAFSEKDKEEMLPSRALDGCFHPALLQTLDDRSVLVFMNVGSVRSSAEVTNLADGRPVLRIEGLASRCLPESVRNALRTLLECHLNYETFLSEKEAQQLARQPRDDCDDGPFDEKAVRKAWPLVIRDDRDYDSLPLGTLQRMARDFNISGDVAEMTKAELVDAIRLAKQSRDAVADAARLP